MVRALRRAALVAAIAVVSSAHIGSPDVWFDGLAGPYKVLVHVEAPPVVPGIAIINIRVVEPGVSRVTAFVNHYDATGGTPPPDLASPVPASAPRYLRPESRSSEPAPRTDTAASRRRGARRGSAR